MSEDITPASGSHSQKSCSARAGTGLKSVLRLRPGRAKVCHTRLPHRLRSLYQRQPAIPVALGPIHDSEEFLLQRFRDRAAAAFPNGDAVDRADGRDLRGGAGEEDLVTIGKG